ncbi:hypothetical protein U9M48_033904 [Paspalum notatum var. saurae]|uniref:Uncharacterized protein n=1 Tax=Paspalum notatum var. saurae TaxID=547442 RepID=A0AAQ3X6P1_PASNO
MENPKYIPEVVRPIVGGSESHGYQGSATYWAIPELSTTPFLPTPTQTMDMDMDIETSYISPEHKRHKRHVPSGERQSLLARRNKQFQATIARNLAAGTEDCEYVSGEGYNGIQPQLAKVINNESSGPCLGEVVATREGECMTAEGDNMMMRVSSLKKMREGYLFSGQDEEIDDSEIDGAQDDSDVCFDIPDPYDKVYSNIPEETHMLKLVANCGHCTAKKFEYEPPGFCCRSGKIKISSHDTPLELRRLWDSADANASHFRDNIRFFNGHFSFTSLYCCLDNMTTNMSDCGIYMFRAHGVMYHNIRSFGREAGAQHNEGWTDA